MQIINDILPLDHIFLDLELNSKKQVFKKVASVIEQENEEASQFEIVENLFNREKIGSTFLASGIAFPYCKYNNIKCSQCFFIRLKNAIDFDYPDGALVKLIVIFIIPEYIDIDSKSLLISLKDKLIQKEFSKILLNTHDLNEIYNVFNIK